jgi:hypothetical protein
VDLKENKQRKRHQRIILKRYRRKVRNGHVVHVVGVQENNRQ